MTTDRPLFGKRVLVTRSREQAGALAELLQENGATPVELPTVSIQPLADCAALDTAIDRLSGYDWAIFTSVNGVEYFFARLGALRRNSDELRGVRLCAIGPATARALEGRGLAVDYVPNQYVAEAVVAGLLARGVGGARILLPRALEAREVIVTELTAARATVDEIPVYQTVMPAGSAGRARALFARGEVDIVTFTSSSTVRNLAALLDGDVAPLMATTNACIGPITAETAGDLGIRVDVVAAEHTIPGLVRAIAEFEKERTR